MLAFLYLIAYLDRANIGASVKSLKVVGPSKLMNLGNAKIEGLMEDLNLTGTQYNICLSIFFVPYILLGMSSVKSQGKEVERDTNDDSFRRNAQ